MVQREKLSRQLATRLAPIGRPADHPLFDHFLVFGYSNIKSDPVKAKCLYQYPQNAPVLLQALEQFVFPRGIPKDTDTRKVATSVLEYHTKNPQFEFVLLLTTAVKEVFYAMCITDDYLKAYPTFTPQSSEPTTSTLPSDTKCYCLVTRYPFFDLMFEVLRHMLDVEEKSLTLPAQFRLGELNQVNRILDHIWSIPPPPPGGTVQLGIPRISNYLRPIYHEDENCINAYCVPTLFWQLDKATILGLISAALLERKLLFISANIRVLSNCILSFVALLKPFVLQCVFIPILPDDLLQIAEAPVPFIAGLNNPALLTRAIECNSELIVIDLDNKKVFCPDEVEVPALPNSTQLSNAIDPYVVKLKKSFDRYIPPYHATKPQKDLVIELLRLLEQYITPYFEAFRRHCVTSLTDNVTVFFKETYLMEETTSQSADFFQVFMETQIFQHWCDLKLKEIDHQRTSRNNKSIAASASSGGGASSSNAAGLGSPAGNAMSTSSGRPVSANPAQRAKTMRNTSTTGNITPPPISAIPRNASTDDVTNLDISLNAIAASFETGANSLIRRPSVSPPTSNTHSPSAPTKHPQDNRNATPSRARSQSNNEIVASLFFDMPNMMLAQSMASNATSSSTSSSGPIPAHSGSAASSPSVLSSSQEVRSHNSLMDSALHAQFESLPAEVGRPHPLINKLSNH